MGITRVEGPTVKEDDVTRDRAPMSVCVLHGELCVGKCTPALIETKRYR